MNNFKEDQDPSPESLYKFLDYTWKDIHHSRLQNWTGITVVSAFHFGIFKSIEYLLNKNLFSQNIKITMFIFGALFCLLGFLITRKHQSQLYDKLDWIRESEKKLKIDKINYNSNKVSNHELKGIRNFFRCNFWTVGAFLSYFYLLLLILDILCIYLIPIKITQ
jgi:hypothetical protein